MFIPGEIYSHKKMDLSEIIVHSYRYDNSMSLYILNVYWISKKSKKLLANDLDTVYITKNEFKEWKHET